MNNSCTYRVHSNCGYPSAVYSSQESLAGEFDIIYGTLDGMAIDDDLDQWSFFQNTQQHANMYSNSTSAQAYIAQSGPRISDSNYTTCNDIDRNMWITITRIVTAASSTNSDVITSRVLEAVSPNVSITFFNNQGEKEVPTFASVLQVAFASILGLSLLFF